MNIRILALRELLHSINKNFCLKYNNDFFFVSKKSRLTTHYLNVFESSAKIDCFIICTFSDSWLVWYLYISWLPSIPFSFPKITIISKTIFFLISYFFHRWCVFLRGSVCILLILAKHFDAGISRSVFTFSRHLRWPFDCCHPRKGPDCPPDCFSG